MHDDTVNKPRWDPAILLVGLLLFLSSLACDGIGDRTPPDNPDLQPPISNVGMEMAQFLEWIGAVPPDILPPPWIVQPISGVPTTATEIDVMGWAVNATDTPQLNPQKNAPRVVLYEVNRAESEATVTRDLGEAQVGENRQWTISKVQLSPGQKTLAARVIADGHSSGWSNFVLVGKMDVPQVIKILSPTSGTVIPNGKDSRVAFNGEAPPDSEVILYRVGESEEQQVLTAVEGATAKTSPDGRWAIPDVSPHAGKNTYLAALADLPGIQSERVEVIKEALMWPLDAEHKRINQWFGECNTYRHLGIDISADGTKVSAVADGKARLFRHCVDKEGKVRCVEEEGDCSADACDDCGCGHFICIDHDSGSWKGYRSCYGHLSKFEVSNGQSVTAGQQIGIADDTGDSSGPHLHFELWRRDASGSWKIVNINPGHAIKGVFPGTGDEGDQQAWWWGEGDDLIALDWDKCTPGTYTNDTVTEWTADKSCKSGAGCEWVCLSTFDFYDMGCSDGDANEAVVKGQVLKKDGTTIKGAELEIWLDGVRWDSPSNPVITDKDGRYEFKVTPGQRVRFESLVVDKFTKILSPDKTEVATLLGCIRTVNFRQVNWSGTWSP
jgi:hypothetical protein